MFDGFAADREGLIVFFVDKIPHFVGAVRIIDLDLLDALARGLLEGELLGDFMQWQRTRIFLEFTFGEEDIVVRYLGNLVFITHVNRSSSSGASG